MIFVLNPNSETRSYSDLEPSGSRLKSISIPTFTPPAASVSSFDTELALTLTLTTPRTN